MAAVERRWLMGNAYPWFKMFRRDWMSDPCLGACSEATRGVWMDALCVMDEGDTFHLTGSVRALARLCRASETVMANALDELKATGTADVSEDVPSLFTLVNRRRKRDWDKRLRDRERKNPKEFHENSTDDPPTENRGKKSESESESESEKKKTPPTPRRGEVHPDFDAWWKHYPKKVDKKNAQVKFAKAMRNGTPLQVLIEGAQRYEKTTDAKYYMSPARWLHGERWKDEQQEKRSGERGIGGGRDFGRGLAELGR